MSFFNPVKKRFVLIRLRNFRITVLTKIIKKKIIFYIYIRNFYYTNTIKNQFRIVKGIAI